MRGLTYNNKTSKYHVVFKHKHKVYKTEMYDTEREAMKAHDLIIFKHKLSRKPMLSWKKL